MYWLTRNKGESLIVSLWDKEPSWRESWSDWYGSRPPVLLIGLPLLKQLGATLDPSEIKKVKSITFELED